MKKFLMMAAFGLCLQLFSAQVCPVNQMKFRPSDNGTDTKAFSQSADGDTLIVDFADQANADNYMFVDFGKIDITGYLPGGYLEVDAEIDKPILRISGTIAEPDRFWPTRLTFTGEAPIRERRHTYRLYFDTLPPKRMAGKTDHLFIFLHDIGGDSKGSAKLKIHNTRLVKSTSNWEQEKNACYKVQYKWREFPELGQYYRGKYDLLVPKSFVEANPFISTLSLNGGFEKSFIGDITWKYDKLMDLSFAQPGKKLENARTVQVPEKPVADQKGGYYIYKKEFNLQPAADGKVYLQFKDLADSAEIFLNGRRIGTQSSVRKRHEWVLKNGSRQSSTWGKAAKEVARFQHFERCGIEFPFDPAAMPDDDVMLLPVYTGQYDWDYVFDVTGAAKNGANTLAVRLYSNPVKGYWIYKHTEDRTYRNETGIFGDVNIYLENKPGFAKLENPVSGTVDANGISERLFTGRATAAKVVAVGHGQRAEATPDKDGNFSIKLKVPADFERYAFTFYAMDRNNTAFDSHTVELNGTVIEFRNDKLYVNGDQFVVRGINGDPGIEWDNDRRQTRRQWLKMLTMFKNLGFNAIRMEGARPQEIADALDYGIMVMPVYAAGSCNTSEVALGNLEKPDHQFNTDAHKEMAITLNKYPNILFWNSGNENHPTAGYNDKILMDEYLIEAQKVLKEFDPAHRPVTYANLDNFGTYWMFTAGQDVLGYNSYQFLPEFRKIVDEMYRETKLPFLFCEWGFTENETRGTALRNKDIDQWEKDMREKMAMMRQAPGCIGGFLYAHHGELKDVRGREFLQEIMASFRLTREGSTFKFENQDVPTLRKVSLKLVSPDTAISSEWADELKPGRSLRLSYPEDVRKASADLRVEISFETHRGLKHSYIRMVDRIK